MSTPEDIEFVSRSGHKLDAALCAFDVPVRDAVCADFGSHTGGFVECLLHHGAATIYAIDPSHGVLHAKLRSDPRVIVCERTNALRFQCPQPCRIVTIDVGWTPQRLILPAARRTLEPAGHVVTLIKPHYEAERKALRQGVLPDDQLPAVLETCRTDVHELGWQILGEIESPLRGHGGNREWLWHLKSRG